MPSNVEIKASVRDPGRMRAMVEKAAGSPARIIHQEDIFFRSGSGRLKLRILSDDSGELIYYRRPDTVGARMSDYTVYRTDRPRQLRALLAQALGETVTVRKKRELYMAGQTRIHLDEVEGLGTFLELEVVLRPGQSFEEGSRIAGELIGKLGINEADLVPCAYGDLIMMKAGPESSLNKADRKSP
jgi:predicted adenylyl cyclase CyaB